MRLARLLRIPGDLWLACIDGLHGPLGERLRRGFWRHRLRHLGRNVRIEPGAHFHNPQFISIADNAFIDRDVIIIAGPGGAGRERIRRTPGRELDCEPGVVEIGRNVHIGPFCVISGIGGGVRIGNDCSVTSGSKVYALVNHYKSQRDPAARDIAFTSRAEPGRQCLIEGPVVIGDRTGVALNCCVMPGVAIGNDCFVAIGSVVLSGDFPDNSMIAGHPARRTGSRYPDAGDTDIGTTADER
jgi:acetyltransferase-like isoleucine patch superfamily enzyme